MDSIRGGISQAAQRAQLANLALDVGVSVTGDEQLAELSNQVKGAVNGVVDHLNKFKAGLDQAEASAKQFAVSWGSTLKQLGAQSTYFYAETEKMGTALRVMARNVGASKNDIKATIEQVKRLGVTTRDATSSVRALLQTRLDPKLAVSLADAARNIGVFARGTSDAMDRVTIAMQTTSTEILQNIGLSENAAQVFARYARQLNINAQSLSEAQKRQAIANYFVQEGTKLTGAYEESMKDAGKILSSMTRLEEEFANIIGQRLVPALRTKLELKKNLYETFEKLNPSLQTFIVATGTAAGEVGSMIPKMAQLGMASFQLLSMFINPALIAGFMAFRGHLQPLLENIGPRLAGVMGKGADALIRVVGAGHPAARMMSELTSKVAAGSLVFKAFGRDVNIATSNLDDLALLAAQAGANMMNVKLAGSGFKTKGGRNLGSQILKDTISGAPLTALEALAIRAQGLGKIDNRLEQHAKYQQIRQGSTAQKLEYLVAGAMGGTGEWLKNLFKKPEAPQPARQWFDARTGRLLNAAGEVIQPARPAINLLHQGLTSGLQASGAASGLQASSITRFSGLADIGLGVAHLTTASSSSAAGKTASIFTRAGDLVKNAFTKAKDATAKFTKAVSDGAKGADTLGDAFSRIRDNIKNLVTRTATEVATNATSEVVGDAVGGVAAGVTGARMAGAGSATARMAGATNAAARTALARSALLQAGAQTGLVGLAATKYAAVGTLGVAAPAAPAAGAGLLAGLGPLGMAGVVAAVLAAFGWAGYKGITELKDKSIRDLAENKAREDPKKVGEVLKWRDSALQLAKNNGNYGESYRSSLDNTVRSKIEAIVGRQSDFYYALTNLEGARANVAELDKNTAAKEAALRLVAGGAAYAPDGVGGDLRGPIAISSRNTTSAEGRAPQARLQANPENIKLLDDYSKKFAGLITTEEREAALQKELANIHTSAAKSREAAIKQVDRYKFALAEAVVEATDLYQIEARIQSRQTDRRMWEMSRLESGLSPRKGNRHFKRYGTYEVDAKDEDGKPTKSKRLGWYSTDDRSEALRDIADLTKNLAGLKQAQLAAERQAKQWKPEMVKLGIEGYPMTQDEANQAAIRAANAYQNTLSRIIEQRQAVFDMRMAPAAEFEQYGNEQRQVARSGLESLLHTGKITLADYRDRLGSMPYLTPGPNLTPAQAEMAKNQFTNEQFDLNKQVHNQRLENLSFLKQTYKLSTEEYRKEVIAVQSVDKETFRQKVLMIKQLDEELRAFWERERSRNITARQNKITAKDLDISQSMADAQMVMSQPPIGSFADAQQWNVDRQRAMRRTTLLVEEQIKSAQAREKIAKENVAHYEKLIAKEEQGTLYPEALAAAEQEAAQVASTIAKRREDFAKRTPASTPEQDTRRRNQILAIDKRLGEIATQVAASTRKAKGGDTAQVGDYRSGIVAPATNNFGRSAEGEAQRLNELSKEQNDLLAERAKLQASNKGPSPADILKHEKEINELLDQQRKIRQRIEYIKAKEKAPGVNKERLQELKGQREAAEAELKQAQANTANAKREAERQGYAQKQFEYSISMEKFDRVMQNMQTAWSKYPEMRLNLINAILKANSEIDKKTNKVALSLAPDKIKELQAQGTAAYREAVQGRVQAATSLRDALKGLRADQEKSELESIEEQKQQYILATKDRVAAELWAERKIKEVKEKYRNKDQDFATWRPEDHFTVVGGFSRKASDFKLNEAIKDLNKNIIRNEAELAAVSEKELLEITANVVNLSALRVPGYTNVGEGRWIPSFMANTLQRGGRELGAGNLGDRDYTTWLHRGQVPGTPKVYDPSGGNTPSSWRKESPTEKVAPTSDVTTNLPAQSRRSGNVGAMDITIKGELTIADGNKKTAYQITNVNTAVAMRGIGDLHAVTSPATT